MNFVQGFIMTGLSLASWDAIEPGTPGWHSHVAMFFNLHSLFVSFFSFIEWLLTTSQWLGCFFPQYLGILELFPAIPSQVPQLNCILEPDYAIPWYFRTRKCHARFTTFIKRGNILLNQRKRKYSISSQEILILQTNWKRNIDILLNQWKRKYS